MSLAFANDKNLILILSWILQRGTIMKTRPEFRLYIVHQVWEEVDTIAPYEITFSG